MVKAHKGMCEAHMAGIKMKWLLRRHGIQWSSTRADCKRYTKGWQESLEESPYQGSSFQRGWAMDLMGNGLDGLILQGSTYFSNGILLYQIGGARDCKEISQKTVVVGRAGSGPFELLLLQTLPFVLS